MMNIHLEFKLFQTYIEINKKMGIFYYQIQFLSKKIEKSLKRLFLLSHYYKEHERLTYVINKAHDYKRFKINSKKVNNKAQTAR